jgi:hypothetical protein
MKGLKSCRTAASAAAVRTCETGTIKSACAIAQHAADGAIPTRNFNTALPPQTLSPQSAHPELPREFSKVFAIA